MQLSEQMISAFVFAYACCLFSYVVAQILNIFGNLLLSSLKSQQMHLCLHMRKPTICICENKGADQLCSYCTADQHLCFAIRIVQPLFFLNPKFQASSLLCQTVKAGLCRIWSEYQIVGFHKQRKFDFLT